MTQITTYTTNKEVKSATPESIGAFEGPQDIKKMYHIYHAINKKYMFTETEKQPRKYVGYVIATDLTEAYRLAQFDSDQRQGVRATSVGDLIQDNYGFYMVATNEFKLICLVDEEGRE